MREQNRPQRPVEASERRNSEGNGPARRHADGLGVALPAAGDGERPVEVDQRLQRQDCDDAGQFRQRQPSAGRRSQVAARRGRHAEQADVPPEPAARVPHEGRRCTGRVGGMVGAHRVLDERPHQHRGQQREGGERQLVAAEGGWRDGLGQDPYADAAAQCGQAAADHNGPQIPAVAAQRGGQAGAAQGGSGQAEATQATGEQAGAAQENPHWAHCYSPHSQWGARGNRSTRRGRQASQFVWTNDSIRQSYSGCHWMPRGVTLPTA